MQFSQARAVSGHVFRVVRRSGPVWYAKYRLPDGRQVQRKIGPAWTGRGRPAAGFFTKRTAEDWLREALDQARAGVLAEQTRTGVTFAQAAREWLRAHADILKVKEWMGHADVQTTMRYLHHAPRHGDAQLVDEAFAVQEPATGPAVPQRSSLGHSSTSLG